MPTNLAPQPAPAQTTDTDLNHIWCCDPDLALCGTDVSTVPEIETEEVNCVVCLDLEDQPCARCGH